MGEREGPGREGKYALDVVRGVETFKTIDLVAKYENAGRDQDHHRAAP